jgi:phosphoglycolate phosphatase-like HAD superfamily hydrolase
LIALACLFQVIHCFYNYPSYKYLIAPVFTPYDYFYPESNLKIELNNMKLVIFDLDQTLVDFISIHDEVTRKLFQQHFKVDARLTEIDFAGRSLTENFSQLARLKNIQEDKVKENMQRLLDDYDRSFIENFPTNPSAHILPGAEKLLKQLSETENLIVLYTGDSPEIVNKVLISTGLSKYFAFSVYGTEVKTRVDMVKLAIEKAESLTGHSYRDKNVVIIGDSIRDIQCGKEVNALTIAVATGFHSEAELLSENPDHLFKSLSDYSKILTAIVSS